MATASRFKVVDTHHGMPHLRERYGWKPCRMAKKKDLRARAMKGPTGVVCPGCKEVCLLPVEVQAGCEFVVLQGDES